MAKPAQELIALTTKTARLKAHLTPKEVAATAGISSTYYAPIERGEVSITVETLYKIAKALGPHRHQPTTFLSPRVLSQSSMTLWP